VGDGSSENWKLARRKARGCPSISIAIGAKNRTKFLVTGQEFRKFFWLAGHRRLGRLRGYTGQSGQRQPILSAFLPNRGLGGAKGLGCHCGGDKSLEEAFS
jgi:hypothetical protein